MDQITVQNDNRTLTSIQEEVYALHLLLQQEHLFLYEYGGSSPPMLRRSIRKMFLNMFGTVRNTDQSLK
ncbi:hypothetical protein HPB50_003460 [Hyalomma asiaticum]|uniref:Uncharacterized protein n=1 Tax=Hyalomma asiaticum TaxID=266040 RepID=A0ACB7RYX4_HYAAI|nr:hypothetical protein HPB50_003460 [Hyalomma asiaticum]